MARGRRKRTIRIRGGAALGIETRAPTAGSHVGQPARRGCGGPAEAGHGVTRRAVATDRRPRRPCAPRRRASDAIPGRFNGPRRRSRRTVARATPRAAGGSRDAARVPVPPAIPVVLRVQSSRGVVVAWPRRLRFSPRGGGDFPRDEQSASLERLRYSTNRDRPSGRGGGGGVADGARVRVRGDRARAGFSPRRARVRRRRRGRESGEGARGGRGEPGARGEGPRASSFE